MPASSSRFCALLPTERLSVAGSLVHDVFEGLAFLEPGEISEETVHRQGLAVWSVVSAMWRQEHILHAVERMTGRQGFNLKNIQSRTANTPLLQRFHEGSFVYE